MNQWIPVSILLITFSFLSCSVGTDPGECDSPECLPNQYTLRLDLRTEDDEGYRFRDFTAVAFFLKRGNRVDPYAASDHVIPSTVLINGISLSPPEQGSYSFYDRLPDTMLAPPGEYNVWDVAGTSDFFPLPPLRDSIQTPLNFLTVTAPLSTDTLSTAGEFEIRLEGDISSASPAFLNIYQSTGDIDGDLYRYDTVLISNAPVRITPEFLQREGFGKGKLWIRAVQNYEQRRIISPEIRSALFFSVEHLVSFILKD